ncbi:OmpA family protein [Bradyrhizobium sp. 21]|uniref:OmpA family protein n=1 Tax=Bradyrhizobium sp. 21 TaxID=2782666 RepID=UPI001FFBB924|nr:OmpA family protein [Bradyrhizobium sp. 21]MCK1389033.1 OmpA family protein [Bradyrhizobium sp. 21]
MVSIPMIATSCFSRGLMVRSTYLAAALVLVGQCFSVAPTRAQSCQGYYDRARTSLARDSSDLGTLDRLRGMVSNSGQCTEVEKTCFAYLIADSYSQAISDLQAKGLPPQKLQELAAAGGSVARTWRMLWTMADLAENAKNYDQAALFYKSSLTALSDVESRIQQGARSFVCPDEERALPSAKQAAELIRLAEQADALATNFVPAPPTRDGSFGGIFVGKLRGIEVVNFPIPIEFRYDSTELTQKGTDAANFLLSFINRSDVPRIVLTGHADQKGSDDYNCKLSGRRLDALIAFMKPAMRKSVTIEAVPQGKGEPFPIVEGSKLSQDEVDQINRRIELRDRKVQRKCQ